MHRQPAVGSLEETAFIEFCPVPVLTLRVAGHETLNADLIDAVRHKMEASSGITVSNRGGWHSDTDFQSWPEACVQTLLGTIESAVRQMVARTVPDACEQHLEGWEIEAWVNVNPRGAYNVAHDHRGGSNMWSGIYYVDSGFSGAAEELTGLTKFKDRSEVPKEIVLDPDPFSREMAIVPRDGLMVLFPASLEHYVEPYDGDRVRITIAFNCKHRGFVIPTYPGVEEPTWMWRNFRGVMVARERLVGKARSLLDGKPWSLVGANGGPVNGNGAPPR